MDQRANAKAKTLGLNVEDESTTRLLVRCWMEDGALAKGASVGDDMICYGHRRADTPVEHPEKDIQEVVG